jgi:hypothetical protein
VIVSQTTSSNLIALRTNAKVPAVTNFAVVEDHMSRKAQSANITKSECHVIRYEALLDSLTIIIANCYASLLCVVE